MKILLFHLHLYVNYMVLTKFPFSFHYYVHNAVVKTKNIICLVNNSNNCTTRITTPGSRKIACFYLTTTFTAAMIMTKNIVFASPLCELKRKSFFFNLLPTLRLDQEKKNHFVAMATTP